MKALLVPEHGPVSVVEFNEQQPDQWAAMVGDETVDFITLREQGLQILVGGRSLLNGSAPNHRVTWYLKGSGRWLSEAAGPVLIVGIHPDSGETEDVNEVLLNALATA